MSNLETIREFYINTPCSTLRQCVEVTGISYNNVKQTVWRDEQRGMVARDSEGKITYKEEMVIPERHSLSPAKQAAWDMFEILQDRARSIVDDEMLLKFSKEIRLYLAELR